MFQVHTFNPHPLLGHCVDSYTVITVEQPPNGSIENTLLPHVTQSLVFSLDEGNTMYDCIHSEFCARHFISGPNDLVYRLKFFTGMKKMIINFKVGGLYKVFHLPVHNFINRSRDAVEFLGQQITDIGNQLMEVSLPKKIDLLNNWLIGHMQNHRRSNRNIDDAIRLIERNNGNISIRELEQATYTTKRTLERHFLEQVGFHPKTFSRLVRFNHVIRFIESNLPVKWRQLADIFGYYDQSHFIHDFKTLTGGLPHDYFTLNTEFEKILQS
jgi:AraC-like DNA-binding protein